MNLTLGTTVFEKVKQMSSSHHFGFTFKKKSKEKIVETILPMSLELFERLTILFGNNKLNLKVNFILSPSLSPLPSLLQ